SEHQDAKSPPARSLGGGPIANENALKHGLSAWKRAGKLPRKYKALRAELRNMAAEIECEVTSLKCREPTLYERAVISTAVRHHGRLALLERWLAAEHATMPLSDRLAVLKSIGDASTARDKALASIGLDRDRAENIFDALYSLPATDASNAAVGVPTGNSNITEK
ncbi:MAG TPA: hypothetical protein VFW87_22105, partial [Pirellulales bacterium]|nr:hypothetical protein [Pirellulales bacterium]